MLTIDLVLYNEWRCCGDICRGGLWYALTVISFITRRKLMVPFGTQARLWKTLLSSCSACNPRFSPMLYNHHRKWHPSFMYSGLRNALAHVTLTIGADMASNPTASGARAPSPLSSPSSSSGSGTATVVGVVGAGTAVLGSGAHSSNSSTATFIDVGTATSSSIAHSSSSNTVIHSASDS